ncbi:MAG: Uma2 family endonuclease [Dehalococcoidia bacterium]|nr:Uma2 family endonuclease [Dehalococcoidia bacterium]
MVAARTRRKFTYEDYKNAPEDKRYELLDGELLEAPSPKEIHQRLVLLLGSLFLTFVSAKNLGKAYVAPFDVIFTNTDVAQPDVIFVSNERSYIITEDNIQGAPDLVVEILSSSTAGRDRTFKRTLYERHGVKEYWMVDTDARNITVLLLGESGYGLAGIYGEGQTLTSPTLSGFSLNLDDIF